MVNKQTNKNPQNGIVPGGVYCLAGNTSKHQVIGLRCAEVGLRELSERHPASLGLGTGWGRTDMEG